MLLRKDLVEKIYQHRLLIQEAELVAKDIKNFILKDMELGLEEKNDVWQEIQMILNRNAHSEDSELAIAQLDLIIAKLRVKRLTTDVQEESQPENVVVIQQTP
ncbi:MAG: hypothetical protein ACI4XL_11235 [Bacillus sp. (in: firmicutes)]